MIRIEHEGVLTVGYYNAMEGSGPIFIDGEPIDNLIKDALLDQFVDGDLSYGPGETAASVKNPLVGAKVKFTLVIET